MIQEVADTSVLVRHLQMDGIALLLCFAIAIPL